MQFDETALRTTSESSASSGICHVAYATTRAGWWLCLGEHALNPCRTYAGDGARLPPGSRHRCGNCWNRRRTVGGCSCSCLLSLHFQIGLISWITQDALAAGLAIGSGEVEVSSVFCERHQQPSVWPSWGAARSGIPRPHMSIFTHAKLGGFTD